MVDSRTSTVLQASYLIYANNLRREAKLCDIILYVQGRMGAMVGYPAHKLLLISASKYFRLLFEREDLRNYCHFPHLSEDGVFAVLDIIYGREIRKETNIEDALMAARFLQVDCAVGVLEQLAEESAAVSPPGEQMEHQQQQPEDRHSVKRKLDINDARSHHLQQHQHQRQKLRTESPSSSSSHPHHSHSATDSPYSHHTDQSSNHTQDNATPDPNVVIKQEQLDVDLTMAGGNEENSGLPQIGFGQGGPVFPGEDFAARLQADKSEANANMYAAQGDGTIYTTTGELAANAGLSSQLAAAGFNVVNSDGTQALNPAAAGGTLIHIFTAGPLDIPQHFQTAASAPTMAAVVASNDPPPQFSTVDIKCLNPHPSVLQQIEQQPLPPAQPRQQTHVAPDNVDANSPWQEMLNDSHSRPNFAWKIVKAIFPHDELKGRNCHGRAGKQRLDPDKLTQVKDLTLKWMPLDEAAEEEVTAAWRQCEIAIDKGIRNMFPKPNTNITNATPEHKDQLTSSPLDKSMFS